MHADNNPPKEICRIQPTNERWYNIPATKNASATVFNLGLKQNQLIAGSKKK
jgi:hypothetical protein